MKERLAMFLYVTQKRGQFVCGRKEEVLAKNNHVKKKKKIIHFFMENKLVLRHATEELDS